MTGGRYPGALAHFHGTDLWDLLRRRAAVGAGRDAVVWQPWDRPARTWTYGQLHDDAAAVAVGLQRRGVGPGDRVLVHLENAPEFLVAWLACAAVGAVAVTTNARSARDELAFYVEDSGVVGAITQPSLRPVVEAAAPGLGWLAVTDHDAGEPVAAAVERDLRYEALFGDSSDLRERAPDPSAPLSVQYTSGTTARPKGVVWTHANALWGARVNAAHEDLRPDDCHLVTMPLFHANALSFSVLASLWVGARFVLVPKWSTSRFWDVSHAHGCTWLSLSALAHRVIARTEPPPHHTYRMFGAGIGETSLDERYGVSTIGWWGMTETISHPIVGAPHTPGRPMSMGRPAPEYGVAVVEVDGRTPVGDGGTGDLLVLGQPGTSLFAEYLNQPAATADSFDEWGWFRTGDRVTVHADGHLTFADRAKDMLKVGAENVAASEIERVLFDSGLVAEVAVVARPDEKLDEVAVAFVVARADRADLAEQLLAACRERLADFKVPRAVHVVAALPQVTLNKVNKAALRAVAAEDADRAAAEAAWIAAADLGEG